MHICNYVSYIIIPDGCIHKCAIFCDSVYKKRQHEAASMSNVRVFRVRQYGISPQFAGDGGTLRCPGGHFYVIFTGYVIHASNVANPCNSNEKETSTGLFSMAEDTGLEPAGLLHLTRFPGELLSHSVNPPCRSYNITNLAISFKLISAYCHNLLYLHWKSARLHIYNMPCRYFL